jgi:hypothetical protein
VVEGDAAYELGRGASQSFTLIFKPGANRSFVENLHLPNGVGPDARLVGTGFGAPEIKLTPPAPDAVTALAAALAADAAAAKAQGGQGAPGAPGPAGSAGSTADGAAAGQSTQAGTGSVGAMDSGIGGPAGSGAAAGPAPAGAPGEDALARANALAARENTPIWVNPAHVTRVLVTGTTTTTVSLAWKPPVPLPRNYRIEIRYLTFDETAPDNLRIDWRPYAQAEVHARVDQVTAILHNLPAGTRETMRVVAVDSAGQLGMPSPQVNATTLPASTWWHPTLLKVLVTLLIVCLVWMAYRRLEERRLLREIEESRLARERREAEEVVFHR